MDGASEPLMGFPVGLLGFYKCDCMSFGLVNAQATFQKLMETYLGDLQLIWCLIYLNNIIVFLKKANRLPSLVETRLPETKGSRTKIEIH